MDRLERADVVLATIAMCSMSGVVLRTAISVTGIGTGLLVLPLTPFGYLLAASIVARELLVGPLTGRPSAE